MSLRIPIPIPPEGIYIILNWAATGAKGVPVLRTNKNNLWQKLKLFEDFIETTVILPTHSNITEIESVELDETVFDSLVVRINWKDSPLTFDCNPEIEEDTLDLLRYFQRKGTSLNEMAQHILEVNTDR